MAKRQKAEFLEDVDVDSVHFVGAPANRRPFAIVKNLAGRAGGDPTGGPIVKFADLLKAIGLKSEGDVDTELTPEQLTKLVETMGREAVAKALGVELPKDPKPKEIDKSKLDPAVAKHLEALEANVTKQAESIDLLLKARDDTARTAITKRIEVMVKAKYLDDKTLDPAKATEVEVAAYEHAFAKHREILKAAGLDSVVGSAEEGDGNEFEQLMAVEVRKALGGREPANDFEAQKIRRDVFRHNPGLLKQSLLRERRTRRESAEA